jgi:hypothetical protein
MNWKAITNILPKWKITYSLEGDNEIIEDYLFSEKRPDIEMVKNRIQPEWKSKIVNIQIWGSGEYDNKRTSY